MAGKGCRVRGCQQAWQGMPGERLRLVPKKLRCEANTKRLQSEHEARLSGLTADYKANTKRLQKLARLSGLAADYYGNMSLLLWLLLLLMLLLLLLLLLFVVAVIAA